MKNALLAFLFFLGGAITVHAQSVYVTKTGTKYHKESCFHLKDSKKEIEFKKVKTLNYSACKHCKPIGFESETPKSSNLKPQVKSAPKNSGTVQCSGKTKAGARCKRKTTNSDGRCYQH